MFSIIQSFFWQGEPCCAWTARSWRGWESSRRRWGRRSSNRSSSCRSEKKSATCSSSAEVSRIMMCKHSNSGVVLRNRVDIGVEGWNRKKCTCYDKQHVQLNVEYSSFLLLWGVFCFFLLFSWNCFICCLFIIQPSINTWTLLIRTQQLDVDSLTTNQFSFLMTHKSGRFFF